MKNIFKLSTAIILVLLFSCHPQRKVIKEDVSAFIPADSIGAIRMARPQDYATKANANGKKKPPPVTTTTTPPPAGTQVVLNDTATIYVNFDGYTITTPAWIWAGPIVCAPANLTQVEKDSIIKIIKTEYDTFNVRITTDSLIYNLTNPGRRQELVITETDTWQSSTHSTPGVSQLNSFGKEIPNFVFTIPLLYNPKYIGDAAAHEIGHSFNLYHQRNYDSAGNLLAEYKPGVVMGTFYNFAYGKWIIGPTLTYTTIQDDKKVISTITGYKH